MVELVLGMVLVACSIAGGSIEQLSLGGGPWYRSFESGKVYNFSVDTSTSGGEYSAHVFQVHAPENIKLVLSNASSSCLSVLECVTQGTHVGMVQLHSYASSPFSVKHTCIQESENCSATQLVMMAVVGIPIKDPIPGGCSLTSSLEIEAALTEAKVNGSFMLTFQSSGIGYDPRTTPPPPCTDRFEFVTRLEYEVYQKCIPSPTINSTFKALEGMLSAERIHADLWSSPFKMLSYSEVKKVTYYAAQQQGVVLNVIARDKQTRKTSAYIPTVSYHCAYSTGKCEGSLSVTTWVCGALVGIMGLYLSLLAHRFFHVEVFLFTLLISVYIMYTLLLGVTDLSEEDLAVATAGAGLCLSILFFILWFFTNVQMLFLMLFGMSMGFVLTAAILYTPLGSYDLVKVSYIYVLILLSGMFLWMVPFVFFSTALNIVSSAVVGSYAITFTIGLLFVHSSFSDVVLRVAKNAAIPGYLSINSHCGIITMDVILFLIWAILCALSITVQAIIEIFRRKSFKRRQALSRNYSRTDSDLDEPIRRQYNAFPSASLFKQLKRRLGTKTSRINAQFPPSRSAGDYSQETRPLLSPNRSSAMMYT